MIILVTTTLEHVTSVVGWCSNVVVHPSDQSSGELLHARRAGGKAAIHVHA